MTLCNQCLWHGMLGCFVVLQSLLCSGCGPSATSEAGLVGCSVLIDGQPAADVRVVMLAGSSNSSSSPILEGISDSTGIAKMVLVDGAQLPSDDQLDFRVLVESLGDWQIVKPWSDPNKSPLSVTWDRSEAKLQVDIPKKAIKPL